jgi:haloacetate dehalogenase
MSAAEERFDEHGSRPGEVEHTGTSRAMLIARNDKLPRIHPSALVSPLTVLTGCRVGANCYLATAAVVLKGATVGDNVRIGAGAIVHATTSLPDGARVGMRHVAVPTPDGFLSTADIERAREAIAALEFFEIGFAISEPDQEQLHTQVIASLLERGPRLARQGNGRAGSGRMINGGESELLPGFSRVQLAVDGTTINAMRGGEGPPVLLLHGYPQTHLMWHRLAPALAASFTVVCPDLRGYGDSAKPPSDHTHAAYSKRVMAKDQAKLMRAFGYERYALVGHDRGARVARRLTLDHPDAITRLALRDIIPTETIYSTLDQQRATTVWRYFLLVQPPNLPERLIGANPDFYLDWTFTEWCGTPGALSDAAVAEYRRCFDQATIHASCEDYRAGATIDLEHDKADEDQAITCPLLVLWSEHGIGSTYDVLAIWREQAHSVRGRALDCGHFLAEERPDETTAELLAFLEEPRPRSAPPQPQAAPDADRR